MPATPVPVLPISPLASETTYDDTNRAFVYKGEWEDIPKQQAYKGSHKVTTRNGAYVTFTFTGQSFSILYKSGPEFRDMNVFVDGVQVGTINEKTNKNIFQQRWDYAGQLAPGAHTLKLVFATSNKSGRTRGSIDAVIVRQ